MVKLETAMFGMGCFWTPQVLFDKVNVSKTVVGFSGGKVKNPSYMRVCTRTTGHVEVVKVWFESKKVSYSKLLKVFWENHDPTTMNRQGPDVGNQYRSVIFYFNNGQKELAMKSKEKEQKKYDKPIVTEIVKATAFYKAEEYHQKYLEKQGKESCRI